MVVLVLVLVLVVVWLKKKKEEKGLQVGTHICRDERH